MYRTALVLGYGCSGRAAERLLLSEGTTVSVCSEETHSLADLKAVLNACEMEVCVVSPGLADTHEWIRAVRAAGVPLLSELELGWSRHTGKTIALTGSNGKSTAVKWICDALRLDGLHAEIGGNYGVPACDVVLDSPHLDWLVLEVSSFQLEMVQAFSPDIAVLLNLLPNHLDRHKTMAIYRQMKGRIFGPAAAPGQTCIAPAAELAQWQDEVGVEGRNWMSFGSEADADYMFRNGCVLHDGSVKTDLHDTLFDNPVLGACTGAAVTAVAHACGLSEKWVEQAARNFVPLPHRLQKIGEADGVVFVNDSKATNLCATAAAVQASGKRIRLIAGGLPKETDFTFIKEILAERVRTIYLVGRASHAMYLAWKCACPCLECGTLEQAFESACADAEPGDTILLSPGCASFDQFSSFQERGRLFASLCEGVVQEGGAVS